MALALPSLLGTNAYMVCLEEILSDVSHRLDAIVCCAKLGTSLLFFENLVLARIDSVYLMTTCGKNEFLVECGHLNK